MPKSTKTEAEEFSMKTLFKSSYVRSKKDVKEVCRYLYLGRGTNIALNVLVALGVASMIALMFLLKDYTILIFAAALVAIWSLQFVMYALAVKSVLKSYDEISNGEALRVDFIVTESNAWVTSSVGEDYGIPFEKIKKIIVKKDTLLVVTGAKLVYAVPKNSFVFGNAADFLNFFKAKGVKIKGKLK